MEHITVHAIYVLSIAVDLANAAVEELKSKNKQGKTVKTLQYCTIKKSPFLGIQKKKSLRQMLKILFACELA